MNPQLILAYMMVAEKIAFHIGNIIVTADTSGMTIEELKKALEESENSWPDFEFKSGS